MKKWIGFWMIAFICCITIAISNYQPEEENVINQARIVLADDLARIDSSAEQIEHEFYTVDLSGEVLYSSNTKYQVGKHVNMTKELQTDHAFQEENEGKLKIVFPLEDEGCVNRFAIFWISRSEIDHNQILRVLLCFLPLVVWAVGILIFLVLHIRRIRKQIYNPIKQVIESSEAIIQGDYSRELVQERSKDRPDGEVEQMIYQFEMMRDELKAKAEREEQLKKSQKELMSCMSHDLRTPITTIQAHAEAMRDGIVKTDEQMNSYLDIMIRKSETLNKMIADLLDHSNAELNQMNLDIRECYFKEYLDGLKWELETYCHKKGCQFQYQNETHEMLVRMDSGRMTQVIYNLIENACKYMNQIDDEERKPEREPLVQMRCYSLTSSRTVCVEVSDNGPGIAMTDIPYVFDRFYRAEKSRSMQIPGAGLGLSICKYIIEQHDGEITLQSRKGEGTKIIVSLPY